MRHAPTVTRPATMLMCTWACHCQKGIMKHTVYTWRRVFGTRPACAGIPSPAAAAGGASMRPPCRLRASTRGPQARRALPQLCQELPITSMHYTYICTLRRKAKSRNARLVCMRKTGRQRPLVKCQLLFVQLSRATRNTLLLGRQNNHAQHSLVRARIFYIIKLQIYIYSQAYHLLSRTNLKECASNHHSSLLDCRCCC